MSKFGYSGGGSDSWKWDPVMATGPRTSVSSINQVHATLSGSPELSSDMTSSSKPGQKSGSGSKPWGFNDPEMKRKKRIAKYKAYAVEGKVKASLKKGVRWFKNKCNLIVHGY